jgi:hypothetical protein
MLKWIDSIQRALKRGGKVGAHDSSFFHHPEHGPPNPDSTLNFILNVLVGRLWDFRANRRRGRSLLSNTRRRTTRSALTCLLSDLCGPFEAVCCASSRACVQSWLVAACVLVRLSCQTSAVQWPPELVHPSNRKSLNVFCCSCITCSGGARGRGDVRLHRRAELDQAVGSGLQRHEQGAVPCRLLAFSRLASASAPAASLIGPRVLFRAAPLIQACTQQ